MRKWIDLFEGTYVGYHGTSTSRIQDMSDGERDTIEAFDAETYFAADRKEARSYCRVGCPQMYRAEFTLKNPYRTNDYDEFAEAIHILRDLQSRGHDGMIFGDDEQFLVFDPKQVTKIEQIPLNESVIDPTALAHQVRDELLAEEGVTAIEFNSGLCMEFSDELERRAPNLFVSFELGNFYNHPEGSDCGEATGFGEKWLANHPEWQPPAGLTWDTLYCRYGFNWTGMHMWAYCHQNRLCYDIEVPDGVSNVFDLPFFQRVIAAGPLSRWG